jgi:hypothetical protein
MKVLCVNPPSFRDCIRHHIKPLKMLATYTVSKVVTQGRGEGYVLAEVDNSHVTVVNNGMPVPGAEVSYLASRFVPLQDESEALAEAINHNQLEEANG